MKTYPKEKTKNHPSRPYRKWMLGILAFLFIGFITTYLFGERAIEKFRRTALQLTVANQQFVAMYGSDIVLVTFNWLASDFTITTLTDDLDGFPRFPEWSADGEWIAFDHGNMAENGEFDRYIYLMRGDGSDLQKFTKGVSPQWSPDGRTIYFTEWGKKGSGSAKLKAINIETGNISDILANGECEHTQGRYTNYRLTSDNRFAVLEIPGRVFVHNIETGACVLSQYARNPIWLDNDTIIGGTTGYVTYTNPGVDYRVEDKSTPWGQLSFQYIYGSSPSVSPKGRYLVYDTTLSPNSLWSPTNWIIRLYDTETGLHIPLMYSMAHASWRP